MTTFAALLVLLLTLGRPPGLPVPPPRPPLEPMPALRLELKAEYEGEPLAGLVVRLHVLGPGGRRLPVDFWPSLRISGDVGVVVFEGLEVLRPYVLQISHDEGGLRLELPLREAFQDGASTAQLALGKYTFALELKEDVIYR
jgi:hypothetical protein